MPNNKNDNKADNKTVKSNAKADKPDAKTAQSLDAKYREILARLNPEQLAAVQYLSGPLLVLAGPGTGKTQLLSARVAYILHETDTNPENILCVTFTDSGCENMRARLASMIGAIPASRVQIHTYHTLGTTLLHLYKNYSETFSRNLDSAIDEVAQFLAVKNIQSNLPATDILKGDRVSDIVETISSAKSNRLSVADLERIAKINTEESAVLSQTLSPLLEKITPRKLHPSLEDAYEPILSILDSYDDATPILPHVPHTLIAMRDDLRAALAAAVESNSVAPLTSWRGDYFEKAPDKSYRLKDTIANKKLTSFAHVMSLYEAYLRDHGLYDFDDMIEEAISALKTDDGFRYTLQEKYQFILLDEFQDTNPSQFEIIRHLTDYENPLIMAVGDDDQAIYEFQGANASNLGDFRDHYGAKVINLVENYRSTQDILDFSKKIIDQLEDSFTKSNPDIEKKLHAHFSRPGEISREEFPSSDGEYFWVADKISQLIQSGVAPHDIAILTPKHKYALPLLPYLHAKHIPISYVQSENILEDRRIAELILLARLAYSLATGRGRLDYLPEILTFPFWQLDRHSALHAIREARLDRKSSLDALKNSPDPKLVELADFFAALAVHSFDASLEEFFAYLLGTLPLDGYTSPFLSFYGSDLTSLEAFDLFDKLSVLRETVKKHCPASASAPKLADFIQMIDDYRTANAAIKNSSPFSTAPDAVSILSAHKSKGLEFDHVFLICADHSAWGKGRGNNNLLSLPKNLIHIRHTGVTDGERLRLLFVAITRARTHLYITNSLSDYAGKSPARLEYLNEYELDGVPISPYIPDPAARPIHTHLAPASDLPSLTNLPASWLDFYLRPTPDLLSTYRDQTKNLPLSATLVTSFIDRLYAGPLDFFKNYVLRVPREPATLQMAFGNAVHHTFEKITKDHISDEDALSFFKSDLLKQDISEDIRAELIEKGPADLAVSLETFGTLLRAPMSRAELDFGPLHLCYKDIPLSGKIDHLSIDHDAKTVEIYDFKTHKYIPDNWGTSNTTLFKYSLQLCFYKLLLNLSPEFKSYTVSRAHILFVTPDRYGQVYDKPYDFDPSTEKLLTFLLPKIHAHITSLDFLSDPALLVAPDESLKLKDILDFIKQL